MTNRLSGLVFAAAMLCFCFDGGVAFCQDLESRDQWVLEGIQAVTGCQFSHWLKSEEGIACNDNSDPSLCGDYLPNYPDCDLLSESLFPEPTVEEERVCPSGGYGGCVNRCVRDHQPMLAVATHARTVARATCRNLHHCSIHDPLCEPLLECYDEADDTFFRATDIIGHSLALCLQHCPSPAAGCGPDAI